MKKKTDFLKTIPSLLFVIGLLCVATVSVLATTPNPGHPWSEVGDGTFSITGPTVMRTYTLPDSNATILTDAATVTTAQGGTGLSTLAQGDILYASSPSTLARLAKDANATRYLSNTGASNNPAWAQVDLTNGVTGILPLASGGTGIAFAQFTGPTSSTKTFTLPNVTSTILTSNTPVTLAQGGTAKALTASNGGILYTDSDSGEILSGTATAGQTIRSGSSAAPSWSTATYPATAGSSGGVLTSDGTNFSAKGTAVTSSSTQPLAAASSTVVIGSLTAYKGGIFFNPAPVTVNQLSYTIGTLGTGGTVRTCIYNEAGTTKLIEVTNTAAANTNNVTVSPAVVLPIGNYYVIMGCSASCDATMTVITSASSSISMFNGAGVPSGKVVYSGTATMTSGTCNSTLPALSAVNNATPRLRLDN